MRIIEVPQSVVAFPESFGGYLGTAQTREKHRRSGPRVQTPTTEASQMFTLW